MKYIQHKPDHYSHWHINLSSKGGPLRVPQGGVGRIDYDIEFDEHRDDGMSYSIRIPSERGAIYSLVLIQPESQNIAINRGKNLFTEQGGSEKGGRIKLGNGTWFDYTLSPQKDVKVTVTLSSDANKRPRLMSWQGIR